MSDYYCPVEGCDYGESEDKSLAAVRSHINASSADGHDWDELKPIVEAQGEDEEGNEDSPDENESDETPDEDSDGNETGDETPSDGADDGDGEDTEMPTPEEYEQQLSGGTEDSDEVDDTPESSVGLSLGSLSDIPTTYLIAGALIVVVLAWLLLSGSDDETTETGGAEPPEESDEDPETVDTTEEPQGGLVG